MSEISIEIDADKVGFDPDRLARIDRHFARYVDDGRLPGWHIAVRIWSARARRAAGSGETRRAPFPQIDDHIDRAVRMTATRPNLVAVLADLPGVAELLGERTDIVRCTHRAHESPFAFENSGGAGESGLCQIGR